MNEQTTLDIDTATPTTVCEHCHEPFTPRAAGKAQRFCSADCRVAFNNSQRSNVSNKSNVSPPLDTLEDVGHQQPAAPEPAADTEPTEAVLLPKQDAVTAYFNAHGGLVIKQEMWPDDDAIVIINATNIDTFIDRLTDLLGYGSAGRS